MKKSLFISSICLRLFVVSLFAISGCSGKEVPKDSGNTEKVEEKKTSGSKASTAVGNGQTTQSNGASDLDTVWEGSGLNGGRYKDGVYFCCAKGEERDSCCEGKAMNMCFQYGGGYNTCVGQSEIINRKIICSFCCPGLQRLETVVEGNKNKEDGLPEGCDRDPTYPLGNFVCSACGNGVCDDKENFCNCPSDCPKQ